MNDKTWLCYVKDKKRQVFTLLFFFLIVFSTGTSEYGQHLCDLWQPEKEASCQFHNTYGIYPVAMSDCDLGCVCVCAHLYGCLCPGLC